MRGIPTFSDSTRTQLLQLAKILPYEALYIILVLGVFDETTNLPIVKVVLEAPLDHFSVVLFPFGEHGIFLLKLRLFVQRVLLVDYLQKRTKINTMAIMLTIKQNCRKYLQPGTFSSRWATMCRL